MSDRNNEDLTDEQIIDNAIYNDAFKTPGAASLITTVPSVEEPTKKKTEEPTFTQWAIGGNGKFSPVGGSVPKLSAGIYEPYATPGSWGLESLAVSSDGIYELPDMQTVTVLQEAEKFWASEAKYRKHNLLFKRGIILYGPPGSGKTITVKLLMQKLIDRNGIIIIVNNVQLATMALKALKRIEPERNIICVFEDIDEIIRVNGESIVLSMLDGEHNVDRVMNLATTNYADLLGARIINRPSRFDRRVYIGMPSDDARMFYLKMATDGALSHKELKRWVHDTKELSIAHLRELVAAVYCLEQPYDEVIGRLKEMATTVKVDKEFKGRGGSFGFAKPIEASQPSGF